jgi:hypothetical protein
MTGTCDECGDAHMESGTAGGVPTPPLLPARVPALPSGDRHALRWVPTDRETLVRVRAALRQL